MKLLLAITLIILGAAAVSAQTDGAAAPGKAVCPLSVADVPGVGALRLRMTQEQVLALFPGSGSDPEVRAGLAKPVSAFGESGFSVIPAKYQPKEKFAGVGRVKFSFIDGRVSAFSAAYDGPAWPHVDKFVEQIAAGTSLPAAEAWAAHPGLDTQMKVLTCTDFEIRVFAGGEGGNLNNIQMIDLEATRKVKELKAKARQKLKQESRP